MRSAAASEPLSGSEIAIASRCLPDMTSSRIHRFCSGLAQLKTVSPGMSTPMKHIATSKLARPSSSAIRTSSCGPPPSPPSDSGNGNENQPRSEKPVSSSGGKTSCSSHSFAFSGGHTRATKSRAVLRSICCSSVSPKSTDPLPSEPAGGPADTQEILG